MIRVFYNYYLDSSIIRQRELHEALLQWQLNTYVDELILFVIPDPSTGLFPVPPGYEPNSKMKFIVINSRPTFLTMFEVASGLVESPEDLSVFPNSDCYLDSLNLDKVLRHIKPEECYALSRWDRLKDGSLKLHDCEGSQDCWIVKGKVLPLPASTFTMGKGGCDHRIAHDLTKAGYQNLNPSRSVQLVHLHESNVRHWYDFPTVEGPYAMVYLSRLPEDQALVAEQDAREEELKQARKQEEQRARSVERHKARLKAQANLTKKNP